MKLKNAFSTLLTVLITAVAVGVLTGVISYSYAISKKDLEIEDLKEQLSQAEEGAVEPGSMNLETSRTKTDEEIAQTPSTTTTDETADWKTYANDKYGFSFKYPGDFGLKENNMEGNINFTITLRKGGFTGKAIVYSESELTQAVFNDVILSIDKVSSSTDLDKYIQEADLQGAGAYPSVVGDFKINILNGKIITTEGLSGSKMLFYIFLNKDNAYTLWTNNKSEINDVGKKILSTFQFTK